jgi:quinol-cytochrome oxidoreductase complex cytochrome b subunit
MVLLWQSKFILIYNQVVTGILLLFYYKGSADLAFEGIQFIMSKVQFGLAGSFNSCMVGKSFYFGCIHSHVQCIL